jgi:hypothetical protein
VNSTSRGGGGGGRGHGQPGGVVVARQEGVAVTTQVVAGAASPLVDRSRASMVGVRCSSKRGIVLLAAGIDLMPIMSLMTRMPTLPIMCTEWTPIGTLTPGQLITSPVSSTSWSSTTSTMDLIRSVPQMEQV